MQTRERRSFVDAAEAFRKLRDEVTATFPAADRSRHRLELLAYLGALLTEFQTALDAYREEKKADLRGPTPPWLVPDAPMAGLREYRRRLLDIQRSAPALEADNGMLAPEIEVPTAGSGDGSELADACDDMAWFLDKYLFVEILAEATAAPALPVEERIDLVDEGARERIPEARRDRTLARIREFLAQGGSEISDIWRLTKAVARRRERIDHVLHESKATYVSAARTVVPRLAESAPWVFEDKSSPDRLLAKIESVEDPENRLRMKRFCTVQIVLETIASWATKLRHAVGDEAVESGGHVTRSREDLDRSAHQPNAESRGRAHWQEGPHRG